MYSPTDKILQTGDFNGEYMTITWKLSFNNLPLSSLVKGKTCFKSISNQRYIDLFLISH